MKEKLISDIGRYIGFLEQCGYTASLSFANETMRTLLLPLIQFDYHPHRICDYLKANGGTLGCCVESKRLLMKKDLQTPCYTCCYAGVEEFLFPVRLEDRMIACIHISGFRGRLERSAQCKAETERLCDGRFAELYEELSQAVPSMEQVSAFAEPLACMIREYYRSAELRTERDGVVDRLYYRALQLLYEGDVEEWNGRELARRLNYSESYLRYVFKKAGKISLQEKINQIRLQKAMRLLKNSNETVTQIAFSLGFSDSNYFSTYFKRQTGLSPLVFRKGDRP